MKIQNKFVIWFGAGFLVAVAMAFSAFAGARWNQANRQSEDSLEHLILKASTGASGKSVSIATGVVDGATEGVFVLDHATGRLTLTYPSPFDNTIAGTFTADVAADMRNEKSGQAEYVMVTGDYSYTGRTLPNNQSFGSTICYVAELNSSKVVAYKFIYDRQKVKRLEPQQSNLIASPPFLFRQDSLRRDQ